MKLTVPASLLTTCQVLMDAGYDTYIVGGAIRDAFLDRPVQEYDITTAASPQTVQDLFPGAIETGVAYGTVTVRIKDATGTHLYEVTTFRNETGYSDHRRPDVIRFAKTIEEDISRRDFTINAIAFNPITKRFVDVYGGINDCKTKCLRAIRNPKERFEEDSLRLFRLCRFVAQMDLQIEPETHNALMELGPIVPLPAIERIQTELKKLLDSDRCDEGLNLLINSHLLERIMPEVDVEKLQGIDMSKIDPLIRMSKLISCSDDYEKTLKHLKLSRAETHAIVRLIERGFDMEKARFETHHLALTGQELMDMGYRGKAIGNIQHMLQDAVLKEKIPNEKQALWDYLRTKLF